MDIKKTLKITEKDKQTAKKVAGIMKNFSDGVLENIRSNPIEMRSPLGNDEKPARKIVSAAETKLNTQEIVLAHRRHVMNCPICMMEAGY